MGTVSCYAQLETRVAVLRGGGGMLQIGCSIVVTITDRIQNASGELDHNLQLLGRFHPEKPSSPIKASEEAWFSNCMFHT